MGRDWLGGTLLTLAMALAGCDAGPREAPGRIAVSSSFFTAAVRETAGETIPLFALAEPGMCPGHFDLRPSQVRQATECRMVIRFDFQRSLDRRFALEGKPPRTVEVQVTGGLCEPQSYLNACRQVAGALQAEGIVSSRQADARLASLAKRLQALEAWTREQIASAGLPDAPVLASHHQAAFCRYLGLNVVETFPSADTALPSEMEQAVAEGRQACIRLVVANRPEGRQAADALADRFNTPVVVLDNFPDGVGTDSFDRLVRGNVAALVRAVKR